MKIKTIVFTGGGSGGHVIPGRTLVRYLKEKHPVEIYYIGSYSGVEKEVMGIAEGIPYKGISTGKLRRYFSFRNFLDLFKIGWGMLQSYFYLMRFKSSETAVFSTGGFVTVPVVVAAWLQGKKIIIHEQTTRVGLANKIASKFTDKVLVSFEDSLPFFPQGKTIHAGYPVQEVCYSPAENTLQVNGLDIDLSRPVLFCTGGGNGSLLLNEAVRDILPELKKTYTIIHQVGKNYLDEYKAFEDDSYFCFDFINSGMINLMKHAKVIISRSGAGTVCELMALRKPSLFIPLKIAQKNEQFHNAKAAEKAIGSVIIEEKDLTSESLLEGIREVSQKHVVDNFQFPNGLEKISKILEEIG